MASKGATAALADTSLKRLRAAVGTLAETIGVEPVVIPDFNRDPQLLIAYQLEQMANFAEALVATYAAPEVELIEADSDFVATTKTTANSLCFLVETLVLDAGLEWETVDFTASAEIDPLTHIEQQMLKALRAEGLLPQEPGEVVMKYVDENGNPTDAEGNPLDVTGSQEPVTNTPDAAESGGAATDIKADDQPLDPPADVARRPKAPSAKKKG